MSKKIILLCLVLAILSGSASAAWQKWWKGLGADDGWNTKWNWNQVGTDKGVAPLATDNAYYDSALNTGSQTDMVIDGAFALNNFKNEDGDMYIVTGGSLTVNGYIDIGGYDGTTAGKSASLTMSGDATLTTAMTSDNQFRIGNYIDGTLTVQDDAYITSWNVKIGERAGVSGHVQLDGGTIETNYLLMRKDGADGTMDVNGDGQMIIHRAYDTEADLNVWIDIIDAYVADNWIYTTTAGNEIQVLNDYNWEFDDGVGYDRWVGTTTISSVPEPATLTLLGIAGIFVRRRRR